LKANDIVGVAKNTLTYLKDRSSKHIHFDILLPRKKIMVQLNDELFSWTIENLVKNGIDAMKGRGAIQILIDENDTEAILQVSDSGVGIEKKAFRTVFEPGYTTKKRGWGLGLSLSKRIIHDYHKGKIKILKSELNKGTTIEVRIKKSHV
jgi:signal transduction histidine kinase